MNIIDLKSAPHWSYSAFQTYLQCPMKYYLRYVEHAEPEHTCSALPFGRAFHAVLSERARKGTAFSLDDAKDDFFVYFKGETEVCENLTYKPEESFESCLMKGYDMLETALENWQDDYVDVSVAEAFSVEVPGLSKPLIGEFDLIVRNDDEEIVCDWKTSASKWQTGKADWDLQATTFCYAYQQLYGRIPLFRFDVFTKAKQPTATNYYTLRTESDLQKFIFLAQQIEKSIQSGLFYPNENCMNCSDCPYKKQCKNVCQKGVSNE